MNNANGQYLPRPRLLPLIELKCEPVNTNSVAEQFIQNPLQSHKCTAAIKFHVTDLEDCRERLKILENKMKQLRPHFSKAKLECSQIPLNIYARLGPELLADALANGYRLSLEHLMANLDSDGNLICDTGNLPRFLECLRKMQSLEQMMNHLVESHEKVADLVR